MRILYVSNGNSSENLPDDGIMIGPAFDCICFLNRIFSSACLVRFAEGLLKQVLTTGTYNTFAYILSLFHFFWLIQFVSVNCYNIFMDVFFFNCGQS